MVVLKSKDEIDLIRESSKIAGEVLNLAGGIVKEGVSTLELDSYAKSQIEKRKGKAAFFGYNGFPANICVSINDEVVHGIPSNRKIQSGDLVKIDIGVLKNGYFGDTAATFMAGKASSEALRLCDVTKASLFEGIRAVKTDSRIGDISYAVQSYVEKNGCSAVRALTGHGIGKELHEDPQVPNFGNKETGTRIKNGMVFCIEPMINIGGFEVIFGKNGWTVSTKDGSLSAHYEHTVAFYDDRIEILSEI
jgi:methionyl aminopeptidase